MSGSRTEIVSAPNSRTYLWKLKSSRRSGNSWYFMSHRGAEVQLHTKHFNVLSEADCCSVCHDEFALPCQTNCSHRFCGECILRVWEYGSALVPCKCPICRQPITLLVPSGLVASDDDKFQPLLTDIATYNLNFDGRVVTVFQRWLHWMLFQLRYPETDLRLLHILHFILLLVLTLYLLCTLNLLLEGSFGV